MRKVFGLDRRDKGIVSNTSSLLSILPRLYERKLHVRRALPYMSVPAVHCCVFHDAAPPNNYYKLRIQNYRLRAHFVRHVNFPHHRELHRFRMHGSLGNRRTKQHVWPPRVCICVLGTIRLCDLARYDRNRILDKKDCEPCLVRA